MQCIRVIPILSKSTCSIPVARADCRDRRIDECLMVGPQGACVQARISGDMGYKLEPTRLGSFTGAASPCRWPV
jgi:hypothetical protein